MQRSAAVHVAGRAFVRNLSYALPSPCASEAEYERFHHLDLERLSPAERWAEEQRARVALAAVLSSHHDPIIVYGGGWAIPASRWLRERARRAGRLCDCQGSE